MKLPIQITFHGMSHSDAIEADVRERARHLERFCDDIVSCRVGLDVLPHPHHQGRLYGVRIDLTITGHELVVDRVEADDVHVALRNAFDSMGRRLEDAVRRRRGFEREGVADRRAAPPPGSRDEAEAG
ncbi:MAG: ribosome-associated translation inhibitor RaiA [Burkholderiales bacterium]|nr:ribosome-associated translation inhibitor RaiA [Burkholderiales bacterium]MDE2299314.1 ribosome-associated translation inhibitor RaiA [Burkholderiales bacterium]